MKNDTFVTQGKYIKDMLKKFALDEANAIHTLIGTNEHLDNDASGNMLDQK
jgi:predicted lipase